MRNGRMKINILSVLCCVFKCLDTCTIKRWYMPLMRQLHSVDRVDEFQKVQVLSLVANIWGILSRIQNWVWCDLSVVISSRTRVKMMLWKRLLFTFVAGLIMYIWLYFFISHLVSLRWWLGCARSELWKKHNSFLLFFFGKDFICFIVACYFAFVWQVYTLVLQRYILFSNHLTNFSCFELH